MTEKELMLTEILNCQRIDLYVDKKPLTAEQDARLREMESRREKGEPLQYILGSCEFMGLKFKVDKRVLVPRPETELLVEFVIEKAQKMDRPLKILDLGTGSGNISVSLAKSIKDSRIVSVDISKDAIDLARINAELNGVQDQIDFRAGDLFSILPKPLVAGDFFDMIVSNPPYIASARLPHLPGDVQREPKVALDGGADGLEFFRRIIQGSPEYLKPGGFLALEIDDRDREAIDDIFNQGKFFKVVVCHKDYSHQERIILAELN